MPSFIMDNLGHILLAALVLFGLNMAKNYGYDQRTREYEIQAQKEKEAREEAVKKANEVIEKEKQEIQERFAVYETTIAQLKKDLKNGKPIPTVPTVVPKPKPSTPATVVGHQDQVEPDKDDPEEETETVIVEVPQELDIAWTVFEQLRHSGAKL